MVTAAVTSHQVRAEQERASCVKIGILQVCGGLSPAGLPESKMAAVGTPGREPPPAIAATLGITQKHC